MFKSIILKFCYYVIKLYYPDKKEREKFTRDIGLPEETKGKK